MSTRLNPAPTILIAEADEDSRFLMKSLLVMNGYRVVEAENGEQAVNIALSERPDLILLELRMPLLDGISATRRIRQTESLRDVPIVALSIFHPKQHRAVALAAGCTEYVRKPVELEQLESLIARLLRAQRQETIDCLPAA